MIVDLECLPSPAGDAENRYRHVEAAIAVIQGSGLTYEVTALGTTLEGEPDAIWATVRAAHEATLASGAASVVSIVKVQQSRDADQAPTIASLTGKFRS
jgi:uncharacterized protein YqgV (UPF0045/DUF77 family)